MLKITTTLAVCLLFSFQLYSQCTPSPTIAVGGGVTPTCQFTLYNFTTQTGMTNYIWTITGGVIQSGQGTSAVSAYWNTSGSKSIEVKYTNGSGCTPTNPTPFPVTISVAPTAALNGPQIVCTGGQVTYTTDPGMSSYQWAFPLPTSPNATVISGQGTNTITLVWNQSTPVTLTVNYINPATGCVAIGAKSMAFTSTPPTASVSGPSSLCMTSGNSSNFYTQTGFTAYNWSVTPNGTITSGQGTSMVAINWTAPGAKTVSVTYNANGCTASANTTVNVNAPPAPITPTGLTTVCTNNTATYTATAGLSAYAWYVSSNASIVSGNGTSSVVVSWKNGGPGSVLVVGTAANGCVSSTVAAAPVLNVTVNGPSITGPLMKCVGGSGTYTVTSGSTGTYNWTISGGTISSGQGTNTIQATWNTAGIQSVGVTFTGTVNGCTNTSPLSLNVGVNPMYTPAITGSTTVCQNSLEPYFITGPTSEFTWSATNATVLPGNFIRWDVAGTQTITATNTNPDACVSVNPTTLNVTVVPRTVNGLATVCAGTTGVTYTTESGYASYNWTISSGGTITAGSTTNTVTVDWNLAGAQTISVLYSGAGCIPPAPVTKNVTVNAKPAPTISGPASVCAGTNGHVYTTQTGKSGYTWTISSGGSVMTGAGTSSVTVLWATAGANTITVSYTENGCTGPAYSYPVTVNARPVPVITGLAAICVNSPSTYTTETGKTGYVWAIVGGVINSGQGTASANVTWNTTGAQSLSVTYADANGCTPLAPTSKPVTVNARPAPTIVGNTPVCASTTGVTYTTEAGKTGYTWTISAGGTITGGQGTNVATVTWSTAGTQSVAVTYTDANGCVPTAPFSKTVTVNARPSPTITGSASQCINTSTGYSTETGKTGYVWSIVGGTINSGQSTASINVTWTTAGAQSVSVTYADANNCSPLVPFSKAVTVNARPVPTIAGVSSSCQNTTGVSYTTESGKTGYTWSISAGGTITAGSTTNAVTVTWSSTGAQSISVNYTDANGCVATAATNKAVTVNSRPAPTITSASATCQGVATSFTTEAGKSGYLWAASGGNTITGQGTSAASITWSTAGSQTVSITYVDANGCSPISPFTRVVTVNGPATPIITKLTPACTDRTTNFSTDAGMSNYLWTVPSGGGTIQGSATGSSVTILWDWNATNKLVSVSYIDGNGCSSNTGSLLVPVNQSAAGYAENPPPFWGGGISAGFQLCGTEQNLSALIASYDDPGTFTWQIPAGETIISQGNVATNSANQITVKWNSLGNKTVILTYTSAQGCPSTVGAIIPVNTKGSQDITGVDFNTTFVKYWGDSPVTLNTTSTSGQAVQWTYDNGLTDVWSVSGNTFTVLNAGTTWFDATAPANACYNAVTKTLNMTVSRMQTHTLTYTPPPAINCDFATVQIVSSANQPVQAVNGGTALGNNTFKLMGTGNYNFRSINNRNVVDAYVNNVAATVYVTPTADAELNSSSNVPFCANEGRDATILTTNRQNINVSGQPDVVWQWMRDGGDISGANSASYVATTGGDYQARVSRNICQYTSNEVTISTIDCTNFTVSPNPANSSFTITVPFTPHNSANFKVFSSTGQQKYSQTMSSSNATLNVSCSSWTNGVYTVQGTFGTTIISKNIVVTH